MRKNIQIVIQLQTGFQTRKAFDRFNAAIKAFGDETGETIEDLLRNQIDSWIKTLPPLPPGWVYDFIPGEPKYNPETDAWETTMEAKPRQMYIIKED